MPRVLHRDYWREKRHDSEHSLLSVRSLADTPSSDSSRSLREETPSGTSSDDRVDTPRSRTPRPSDIGLDRVDTPRLPPRPQDDARSSTSSNCDVNRPSDSLSDLSSLSKVPSVDESLADWTAEGDDVDVDRDDWNPPAREDDELDRFLHGSSREPMPYRYQPLPYQEKDKSKAFRLLTLRPGKDFEPVVCKLSIHQLDSPDLPEYVAISYHWGDVELAAYVEVIDNYQKGHLQIPPNLKLALKHLRSESAELRFWADAICIKQHASRHDSFDHGEKRHQLDMMREIYQNASTVSVFLGASESRKPLIAFDVCHRIVETEGRLRIAGHAEGTTGSAEIYAKTIERLQRSGQSRKASIVDEDLHYTAPRSSGPFKQVSRLASYRTPKVSTYDTQCLLDLFKMPWFKRTWVLQEAAYGREVTVHFGDEYIPWEILAIGASVVRDAGKMSGSLRISTSQELMDMVQVAKLRTTIQHSLLDGAAEKPDILDLLNRYRRWQAIHPEDKIYALLSLTSEERRQSLKKHGFEIDFDRSVEETYRRFAEAILASTESVDLFNSPKGQGSHSKRLPSWVPDWSDTGFQADMNIHSARSRFRASGSSRLTSIEHSADGDRIVQFGSVIDHVKELGDPFTRFPDAPHDLPLLEKMKGIGGEELKHFINAAMFFTDATSVLMNWSQLAGINDTSVTKAPALPSWIDFRKTLILDHGAGTNTSSAELIREAFRKWQKQVNDMQKFLEVANNPDTLEEVFNMLSKDSVPADPSARFQNISRISKDAYSLYRGLWRGSTHGWDIMMSQDIPLARVESIQGLRLARTGSGLLALVPEATEDGDNVVLLRGGSMPYILRPQGRRWKLIGCAYVNSVMQGERWHEKSCFPMDFV